MKRLATDAWTRSRNMVGLAASLAGQELRHRVRAGLTSSAEKIGASELMARVEQARLLAESLGRMKGALMKAGQLLSIESGDFLPPEAQAVLGKLQAQAEPVDFVAMRQVLIEDLGYDRLAAFEGLDETPAASASIGQVYRARAGGVPVAVKVQYPGVRESIDSDLSLLEKLGSSWLSLTGRDIDVSGVFEELRGVLHLEADYARERACLDRFGQLVAGDPRFVVPRSFPELSGTRVLTMSWEEGQMLGDWLRSGGVGSTGPTLEDRRWLGRTLLDLYCLEFFRWGLVQTDPNFGNFLLQPATRQVVLLDFGATLEFEPEFRRGYVELLRAVGQRDPGRIVEQGIAFGLLDPRESAETRDLFAELLTSAVEPFDPRRQPFVFADDDYKARARDVGRRFVKSLAHSPPPRRLIFLHRKLGGLFHLLRRLDVQLDLRPYWERMVEGIAPGES